MDEPSEVRHPSRFDLEQHFAAEAGGDRARSDQIASHVAGCGECRDRLGQWEQARAAFALKEPPADFARRLRLAAEDAVQRAAPKRSPWFALCIGFGAAAAAVFVWKALPGEPKLEADPPTVSVTSPATVRWRGSAQLAVVVQRGTEQFRETDRAAVQSGDGVRVEVALEQRTTLTVGILEDDETWTALSVDETWERGTHFLPRTMQVDDSPTSGWLLAGPPDAVQQVVSGAKAVRDAADVRAIRLEATTP